MNSRVDYGDESLTLRRGVGLGVAIEGDVVEEGLCTESLWVWLLFEGLMG